MNDSLLSELLAKLAPRFATNMPRHQGIHWADVEAKIRQSGTQNQNALHGMELTGGEPDVVGVDPLTGKFIFVDCAAQSPLGRRSLCYDQAALDARKNNKPVGSAMELATQMGAQMLTEAQYRELQTLGEFDTKTSSWLQTPVEIRMLGGAIFGDRRYGQIFTYHNGADSYYAARGFRTRLLV
ncbi:DUF4256 domain-containing protein [Shewanella sp. HN-41]|uniref:DUF4256 domain-containing protein n=1 Tax=Shewanella sp. HN-41 TaxID=327275 RepID=UPI0002125C44|nr:DUF4256 domain-containing protein [Shewanella sp. HN-41]EGM71111.1 hypothetical protein SOHN41_00845 [Shewanella sp. HN-41]